MESPGLHTVPPAPEGTRLALIEAGFRLFAAQGFDGASTRRIAAAAGTNVASIAYHFGGKAGLRAACGDEFARRMSVLLGAGGMAPPRDAAAARADLHAFVGRIARFAVASEAASTMVGFMLRELAEDGQNLARLYAGLFEPLHRQLCLLWSAATGRPAEDPQVRLAIFTLLGQVFYFRIGRPLVLRRMGWDGLDGPALAAILDRLHRNIDAMLDSEVAG
ncbi:MAG: CerR family C-terminal domain-containing protein [Rhodobacteraceae bacterium]|nr:CerR family C-terminal domain-containing protein [Paracoccaceae bacterium]